MSLTIYQYSSAAIWCAGPAHVKGNTAVLQALVAWAWAEDSEAQWNPWDTTEPGYGGWKYNSVGVRNYPSEADGLQAWWRTLTNGYYPEVLAELKAGTSAVAIASAIGRSPWGTEPFENICAEVEKDWFKYGARLVAGS